MMGNDEKMSYTNVLNSRKADISVFYKAVGNLKLPLQVFLPDNFDKRNKYKTVIAIHGGAWQSFKETPVNWDGGCMADNVKYYTEKGYVGIVFSYRDLKYEKNSDVGDILEDCYDALQYISTNFSFLDRDNVVFMGDSAGGHLVLCLSMGLPDGKKPAIKPNKIAVFNPVTDCVIEKWNYCAEDAIKYSPMHNAKYMEADILVMHGTADTVVNIEDSRLFVQKLKSLGNNVSMIEIPNASHAFILFGYISEETDVLNALKLTDDYLDL